MSALPDEYEAFCEGLRRLTEIDLAQYKRAQMERRIRAFAERRRTPGLRDYLGLIEREEDELDAFLDRMTINVSQLWRNPEQWRLLAERVLSGLADRARIRVWSAGCSYGAEAYTAAALCSEAAPGARLDVLGTDIDRRMVERAREGRFSADDARDAPPAALQRWFEPAGEGWRARAELRNVTRFEAGDLLRMPVPVGGYDLILCRNTVIYFSEDVRDRLHGRLAEALRPGGHLLVGSTERVANPRAKGLEPAHPFVYRKA